MTTESSVPRNTETIPTNCERPFHHSLCWGDVLAGTAAAIGIHLLLTALGMGAGLAIFRPMADTNPVAHFSVGATEGGTIYAPFLIWNCPSIVCKSAIVAEKDAGAQRIFASERKPRRAALRPRNAPATAPRRSPLCVAPNRQRPHHDRAVKAAKPAKQKAQLESQLRREEAGTIRARPRPRRAIGPASAPFGWPRRPAGRWRTRRAVRRAAWPRLPPTAPRAAPCAFAAGRNAGRRQPTPPPPRAAGRAAHAAAR